MQSNWDNQQARRNEKKSGGAGSLLENAGQVR